MGLIQYLAALHLQVAAAAVEMRALAQQVVQAAAAAILVQQVEQRHLQDKETQAVHPLVLPIFIQAAVVVRERLAQRLQVEQQVQAVQV